MRVENSHLVNRFGALFGEMVWHSLVLDSRIAEVSQQHAELVLHAMRRHKGARGIRGSRVLEVGCYAHFTGYLLQAKHGADVTLLDISSNSLKLGRRLAGESKLLDGVSQPRLVAGSFHELPFEDGSFDLVFICSSLHHTWEYGRVVGEMCRVLAPDGLLLLEQEPSRRGACFYKFRTNRLESMTPFEKRLQELDLLRVFAEPYLGSRPESLFGMVENQEIPLDELLMEIRRDTDVLELDLDIETMTGGIEKSWLERKHIPVRELAGFIYYQLAARREEALPLLTERERGLGFGMPDAGEIQSFADRVAAMVCALPPERDPAYRVAAARIFGAPVRLVSRKRRGGSPRGQGRLSGDFPIEDGVFLCFPEEIRRLVRQGSVMPSIQHASPVELEGCFPPACWSYYKADNQVAQVSCFSLKSEVLLPAEGGALLVLLRLYAAEQDSAPFEIRVLHQGETIFRFAVFQPESFLFADVVATDPDRPATALHIEAVPLPEPPAGRPFRPVYSISVAAAYRL